MASNKVKFKVSIKELVFEYEGDNERAQVLHGRITETLGSLAAAQADAIDITPARQLPAAPTTVNQPIPPKRRRRTRRAAVNGDAGAPSLRENGDSVGEQTDGKPVSRKQRARGTSYQAQVASLVKEGFFATKRTTETVHAELIRRGHTFEPYRITAALVALTQNKKLSRTANAAGDWEYESGATT